MQRFLLIAALALPAAAQSQAVAVTLTEWKVGMSRDTVRAGSVTFRVNNAGTVGHQFFVLGDGVSKGTRDIAPKQSATLTIALKSGTYEVYCSMSDESHKNAGMKNTLVVIPAEPATEPKKPPR